MGYFIFILNGKILGYFSTVSNTYPVNAWGTALVITIVKYKYKKMKFNKIQTKNLLTPQIVFFIDNVYFQKAYIYIFTEHPKGKI